MLWRKLLTVMVRPLSILCIVGLTFYISQYTAAALQSSVWLSAGEPNFAVRQKLVADSDYPNTISGQGNIDCDQLTFTKRNGGVLNLPVTLYREDQISDCFVSTSIGQVSANNGYINIAGTNHIAEATDITDTATSYRTFPNSDTYISNASSAPVGIYIWFKSLQTAVMFRRELNGKIWAKFSSSGQTQLTDKSGTPLPVMGDNYAVSDNGEWLLVDSPGRAVIRVNLLTGEVLPFANSFELGNGTSASLRMAISSDGQHALLASKSFSYFTVFDLTTCGVVPTKITKPVTCQSRDLNSFIRSRITDMGGVLYARFTTDNLLNLYASYNISTTPSIGNFILSAPGTPLKSMDYLGMGDSFSSGEGAFKYEVGTDEKGINLCHLSTVSYPYVIAKKIAANSFHSVACSGAKTTNIVDGIGNDKALAKYDRDNQYESRTNNNSLGNWIPGYQKQLNFITENNPQLITLSVIGNDLGFSDIVTNCAKLGTCYSSYEDQLEIFNLVDSKLSTLVNVYKKLKKAAPVDAKIYAIGYPQVALATGNCGLNVHMNNQELSFASSLISRINQVVQTAASQAGIQYADVENAFIGFRLCEATTGTFAVNGLTAGKDIHGIIGNESYHPTELGQFMLAQEILNKTKNFSTSATSNTTVPLPAINPATTSLVTASKTNRTLNKKIIASKDSTIISPKSSRTIIKGINHGLVSSTTYAVSLDTIPQPHTTSDINGNLDFTLPITNDGLPHTINVYGTDLTSTPIDVVIFFTALPPETTTNLCQSGLDIDQDSIDDACDPIIGLAPVALQPVVPTQPAVTPQQLPAPAPVAVNTPQNSITSSPSPKSNTIAVIASVSTNSPANVAPSALPPNTAGSVAATNGLSNDLQSYQQSSNIPIQSPSKNDKTNHSNTTRQPAVLSAATTSPTQIGLLKKLKNTRQFVANITSRHPLRATFALILLILLLIIYSIYRYLNQPYNIKYSSVNSPKMRT